jgi:ribosome maturation factor RimP
MTHPLIPQIIDLAAPVAESLELEVVGAVFHTHQRPPVLRVDIRNGHQDTSLDDCERMSQALEAALDASNLIQDSYVLEVSSPGVGRMLMSDREFRAFKGFAVIVSVSEPDDQQWTGQLVGRDEANLMINQKGRILSIPRQQVIKVQLDECRSS